MDTFARGLKSVAAIPADGGLTELVKSRYASWDSGIGAAIEAGKEDFTSLGKLAPTGPTPFNVRVGAKNFARIL
jgi:xylose isomerase